MKLTLLFIVALAIFDGQVRGRNVRGPLIWQEEFDTPLDRGTWKHLITGWRGGNNEFQYYSDRPENSYTRGGILYIKPSLTADEYGEDFLENGTLDLNPQCNINIDGGCVIESGTDIINPIQSARMVTSDSFSFTYGTVEVRAKMPKGDWLWPAIWMLPTDEVYGGWPRSGEIDIVEVRGNENFACGGNPIGRQLAGQTMHWGPDPGNNRFDLTHWERVNTTRDYSSDFHLYRVEWLTNGLQYYIDDVLIGEVYPPPGGFWQLGGFNGQNLWSQGTPMAPFDQRFHFILNLAVGGNFFPDGCVNVPFNKPWASSDVDQMRKFWSKKNEWYPTWNVGTDDYTLQVDYIRVYSL